MLLFNCLFLLCIKYSLTLNTMPVFLIDNGNLHSVTTQTNPFALTISNEFATITDQMANISKNIIFFIEQTFSMEDVSCKDKQGTPYVHLHKYFLENKVKYFPKVEEPYKLIEKKFESSDSNTYHLQGSKTRLQIDELHKPIYAYFEDSKNETRVETLRRHDAMIREMLFAIKQLVKGPVTAIYTGLRNPIDTKLQPRKVEEILYERSREAERRIDVLRWLTVRCDNGTFSFYDGKLVNGFDARMVPRSCQRVYGSNLGFTYKVVFESTMNDVLLRTYQLLFHFTYQNKPEDGWILNQMQWTKKGKEIGKLDLNVANQFDKFYQHEAPETITPNEWYDPALVLTNFKIRIATKEDEDVTETTPDTQDTTHEPYTLHDKPKAKAAVSLPADVAAATPVETTTFSSTKEPTRTTKKTKLKLSTKYVDFEVQRPGLSPAATSDRKRQLHLLTSGPLLSAFLISFLLLSILGWGINMLGCVQANDRYDSREKKSLSVSEVVD